MDLQKKHCEKSREKMILKIKGTNDEILLLQKEISKFDGKRDEESNFDRSRRIDER